MYSTVYLILSLSLRYMTPPSPPWVRVVPVDNTDSSNRVIYNITLPEVLDYNATIWVSG